MSRAFAAFDMKQMEEKHCLNQALPEIDQIIAAFDVRQFVRNDALAFSCCMGLFMNSPRVGLLLIGLGVLAILAGLLVWSGALAWFGRLPGDIRYERGSTRIYFPVTSMLLVSAVLTLVLNLLRRFF